MEKELLEELLSQEKTLSQISEITGKGKTTIRYWIAQHQLDRIKNTNCEICQALLTGRQRNFCSIKCKQKSINFKHQNYTAQQARGLERKKQLIEIAGGECCDCGYKRNISALEFHHLNPEEKSFGIDLRKCSCANWESLVKEVKKCVLICANCHRERHNPELILN